MKFASPLPLGRYEKVFTTFVSNSKVFLSSFLFFLFNFLSLPVGTRILKYELKVLRVDTYEDGRARQGYEYSDSQI